MEAVSAVGRSSGSFASVTGLRRELRPGGSVDPDVAIFLESPD